jgi:hypothetical protein
MSVGYGFALGEDVQINPYTDDFAQLQLVSGFIASQARPSHSAEVQPQAEALEKALPP